MDDFEKKLKKMSVRKPDDQLKDRIFGESITIEPINISPQKREWRIPIGWAAALILLMSCPAYFLGRATSSNDPVAPNITKAKTASVQVQIVEVSKSEKVFFDFTESDSNDFETPLRVQISSGEES